jgi:hypothetical protein
MAKASPSGKGHVDRIRRSPPSDRQTSGASTPTAKAPKASAPMGGHPKQTQWGDHLQGSQTASSRRGPT